MSEKEAKEKVSGLVSGDWELFESSSKALTEGNTTLEKDDFIFERALDGIPVNYVREISLPVDEQALEWENEDGTLHEGQSEGWENEVLTMDFCSGTIQSFLHRNPIEASNVSDERLFLLPFDEVKDIFEKTITLQVMTEDKNRMIAVDGGSNYRYPSIDAQSAEITITKVQLGYMCMPDSEGSDTEAVLIPVWDFYGTWTSKEPEYEYGKWGGWTGHGRRNDGCCRCSTPYDRCTGWKRNTKDSGWMGGFYGLQGYKIECEFQFLINDDRKTWIFRSFCFIGKRKISYTFPIAKRLEEYIWHKKWQSRSQQTQRPVFPARDMLCENPHICG